MSAALDHMAARVAADPFFLAHSLAEYARSERLDDPALAARLGCRVEDLSLVRLCRTPRPDPAEFRADIAAIAARFRLDLAKLAEAVRHGQGLATLREAKRPPEAADFGICLAARDATQSPPKRDAPS